jgi:hypothetical protein
MLTFNVGLYYLLKLNLIDVKKHIKVSQSLVCLYSAWGVMSHVKNASLSRVH